MVTERIQGLKIIEVTHPYNPVIVGSIDINGSAEGVSMMQI